MTTVLDSLNTALHTAMQRDWRVILLGEDILDPYGGAFKVARGLSTAYPERVWTTPISEGGFVGLAAGLALRGLRPVVEIMFGDFVTLAADQLINHAAKFAYMYNGNKTQAEQASVPMVVRTPMGGRRGYGPTHSQSLEKHFLGTPGLRVLAPTNLNIPSLSGEQDALGNPGALAGPGELLLHTILDGDSPTLFIENKLLYLLPVLEAAGRAECDCQAVESASPGAPAYRLSVRGAPPARLTLAAYGYMAELARQAMLRLAYEQEIFAELVVLTQLAPFTFDPILDSAGRTGRLLTIEEGAGDLGWGAEIVARAVEALPAALRAARLAAAAHPIPASGPLEAAALPSLDQIIRAGQALVAR